MLFKVIFVPFEKKVTNFRLINHLLILSAYKVVSNPNIGQTLWKLLPSMLGEIHCSYSFDKWWLIGQEIEISVGGLNDAACLSPLS